MRGISIADYHVHPDFSFDAEGSVDDFCQMGLAQGLAEICFTTHYDTNPILIQKKRSIRINGELHEHSIKNFGAYVDAVKTANEQYNHYGLSVKCGVELGYYPGCEQETKELFETYPLDYKIGSIHEVDEYEICYEKSMKKCGEELPLEEFGDRYFSLVRKLLESNLFDVIGHLDRYRTYGLKCYGEEIKTIHKNYIEPVFELMKSNDVGYEINTLSVHFKESDYYPSMDIINMARSSGTRIMSIGSDAHKPNELSRDFDFAASLAYELYPYRGE